MMAMIIIIIMMRTTIWRRVWLVVLLGASISVVVNSACAGFLSGVIFDLVSLFFIFHMISSLKNPGALLNHDRPGYQWKAEVERPRRIRVVFILYIIYLFLIMVSWCLGGTLGSQDDLVCLTTWQFLQSGTMKPCWYTLAHHHYESFLLAELTSLEIRFTLPFNLVAWTLWSLLLELGPGREEVNNQNLKPAKRMKFFMIFFTGRWA